MKRNNVRRLIRAIKATDHFNWRNPKTCIGGFCERLLEADGIDATCGTGDVQTFLGISEEEAHNLYTGRSLDFSEDADKNVTSGYVVCAYELYDRDHNESHRQAALKYLRQFAR